MNNVIVYFNIYGIDVITPGQSFIHLDDPSIKPELLELCRDNFSAFNFAPLGGQSFQVPAELVSSFLDEKGIN